jgi:hypothetical protein
VCNWCPQKRLEYGETTKGGYAAKLSRISSLQCRIFVSTLVSSLACPMHADNAGTGLLCALASRPAAPRRAKRKKECSKGASPGGRHRRPVTCGPVTAAAVLDRASALQLRFCSFYFLGESIDNTGAAAAARHVFLSALQSTRMQSCVFLAQNACISLGWPEPARLLSR